MMHTHFLSAVLLAATLVHAHAQGGSLTPPPGPPTATMKPLDVVEPRIPLVAGSPGVAVNNTTNTITISQPGSYYLTKNLQIIGNANGIEIQADHVSLDLMGFAIISPPTGNAGFAIYNLPSNTTVKNGIIQSTTTAEGPTFTQSGFSNGFYSISGGNNIRLENLAITGVRQTGILVTGRNGIVSNCRVNNCGDDGIFAIGLVIDSAVNNVGDTGIYAFLISNCRVQSAFGRGMDADYVTKSWAISSSNVSTNHGITADLVESSQGLSSGGHGISAGIVYASYGEATNSSQTNHGISASRIVTASYGSTSGGNGIECLNGNVAASQGRTTRNLSTAHGIRAAVVSQSYGAAVHSSGGNGIEGVRSVTASFGESAGRAGIFSSDGTVADSFGLTSGAIADARGINAQIVTNCRGSSTSTAGGEGILANTLAMNSSGVSSGASGISVTRSALNCYGFTSASSSSDHGIFSAQGSLTNCWGWSNGTGGGSGIHARIVTGSTGFAAAGALHGINARIVHTSYGHRETNVVSKFGLRAAQRHYSEAVNGELITNSAP